MEDNRVLKPDVALKNISEDKLSRSKFAENITNNLIDLFNKNDKESIVIGLYGEWGSGKSTLINFIKEFINDKIQIPQKSLIIKIETICTSFYKKSENLCSFMLTSTSVLIKLFLTIIILNFAIVKFLASFAILNAWFINIIKYSSCGACIYKIIIPTEWIIKLLLIGIVIVTPVMKVFSPLKFLLYPFHNIYLNWKAKAEKSVNKPIIVDFNPWNINDEKLFLAEFFNQLISAVSTQVNNEKVVSLLQQYSETLLGELGKGLKIFTDEPLDLSTARLKLEEELKKQQRTMLIFIDDIDRLSDSEIYKTMRLINSIANLPNIIYFMSLDRDIVSKALGKYNSGNGDSFLEKIIQVSFEIPALDEKKFDSLFFNKIDEFLVCAPHFNEKIEEKHKYYWSQVYFSGFRALFSKPRDVYRFINTLKITYNSNLQKEINPVDFMVVTAFQLFAPSLYYFVLTHKNELTTKLDSKEVDTFKEEVNKILSAEQDKGKDYKRLLTTLFPNLESMYSGISYGQDYYGNWRKDGRICCSENFDKFFMYDIPTGTIALSELEDIVERTRDKESFAGALLHINDNGEIKQFLQRLEDYTASEIPKENITNVASVLFDVGDFFPLGDEGMFSLDIYAYINRIIYQLFKREISTDDKLEIITNAISSAERSIFPVVNYLRYIRRCLDKKEGSLEEIFLTEEQFNELATVTLNKIYAWQKNDIDKFENADFAFNGSLIKHHKLGVILYFWLEYGDKELLTSYIKNITQSTDALLAMLKGLANTSKTYGGTSDTITRYTITNETLLRFFDCNDLKPQVEEINKNIANYDDANKQIIISALKAINNETQDDF